MPDIAFLPLLLAGVLFLGSPFLAAKAKANYSRLIFGLCMTFSGLLFWVFSALLLVYEGKIVFMLDFLMIPIFLAGIALLLPRPSTAAWSSETSAAKPYVVVLLGLVIFGAIAGLAHAICTQAVPAWPAYLLKIYGEALGVHGPPLSSEGVRPF